MSERIEKLAELSIREAQYNSTLLRIPQGMYLDYRIFAEKLIRECGLFVNPELRKEMYKNFDIPDDPPIVFSIQHKPSRRKTN